MDFLVLDSHSLTFSLYSTCQLNMRRMPQEPSSVLFLSPALPPVRFVSGGLIRPLGCGGPRPLAGGGFQSLFRLFLSIFFGMMRRRLHLEGRIRSSPPYPCPIGASRASRGRVESSVQRISWNIVGFCICFCDFRLVSFDLWLSLLVMVVALVCWSFRALARRLSIFLLQQALLRQAFVLLEWRRGEDGGAP
jgi:hypothetical protein